MAYSRKWKPSKAKINEFKKQMEEIDEFCRKNSIQQSSSSDSYYFTLNGQKYRVSNHTIESSNAKAFNRLGESIRQKYHPDKREDDIIYIHASKTRIIEIFTSIKEGYEIDGRGNRISEAPREEPTKVPNKKQEYYKMSDGFFDYYVNKETGEKKFELEDKDVCIDPNLDDFFRPNSFQEQTSMQMSKQDQDLQQEVMTKNVNFKYEMLENNTVKITEYLGEAKDVLIPEEIDGYKVMSIDKHAFENCSFLKSIELHDNITHIDTGAFYNCTSLESIKLPEGITSIGDHAFLDCTSLKSIELPNNITSIGEGAFAYCNALKEITIPKNVSSIGRFAFSNCTSLKEITISESITNIGNFAFSDCTSLESIRIPESVTGICEGAFENCTSLKSIELPDSITSIGDHAFSRCKALKSVKLPESITSIEDFTFAYCKALESIELPDSITSVGEYAFYKCYSLESIELPEGITSIGKRAFDENTQIIRQDSNQELSDEGFNMTM